VEPADVLATNWAALRRTTTRLAAKLRFVPSLECRIPRSRWTAREAVAHLVAAFDLSGELAAGMPSPVEAADRVVLADWNDKRMADIGEQDPAELAALLEDAAERFGRAIGGHTGDQEIIWHAGFRIDLNTLVAILLGEVLLHGYDTAVALGEPWTISPGDARLALAGYTAALSLFLDTDRPAARRAAFGIEIDGTIALTVRVDDGSCSVGPRTGEPVDGTVSADPVALLLVLTGRLDPVAVIALGSIRLGGPHPEAAIGLFDLFRFP
jgi:uncharacterized protein (TIGR03083 family)